MKTSISVTPVPFPPITLTFTLETAAEVQALYDVCNFAGPLATHLDTVRPDVGADRDQMERVLLDILHTLRTAVGLIGHGDRRLVTAPGAEG